MQTVQLRHIRSEEVITVTIEEVKQDEGGDTVVQYRDLPEALQVHLENYSKEELLLTPHMVLRSICRIQAIVDNPEDANVLESVI